MSLRAGPLDLGHLGTERVIGAYLVDTDDGLALHDCGPATCVDTLKQRLAEYGVELGEIRHLLLSHIHLDHAGATGVLVRDQPALQVHVSEIGAPHLVDPSRLERSARRLYGEEFDRLWGELVPVPAENVHVVDERVLGLECFPSPGHASHHVCYLDPEGTLYAGDAAGVRIAPAAYVVPPAPPPEFDREAWHATIDEIERRAPERLALVHFGTVDDVASHLVDLRRALEAWTELVERGATLDEFVSAGSAELHDAVTDEAAIAAYEQAIPFWHSYLGIARYWEKRREAA